MVSGWRYRVASACGTALLTGGAVVVANHPFVQTGVTMLPPFDRLPPTVLGSGSLLLAVATATAVVAGALVPLYEPRPRRILDAVGQVLKLTLVAGLALAAVGYFDYTYRLPRTTLLATMALLGVLLPAWFLAIRPRPLDAGRRAVLVGDEPERMATAAAAATVPVLGYVSPGGERAWSDGVPDGGVVDVAERRETPPELDRLGGLARLEEVILDRDVDTVILAFADPDRDEFFGTLDICHRYGLAVQAHHALANSVLHQGGEGPLVDVDLEPWPWYDRALKRVFDVCFAAGGLVALAPVMLVIAVAVRLDSPGPVLYSQERTSLFGDRFTVYKFRSMVPDAEAGTGARLAAADDPRVTRVGRVLRQTHLDEIPQLWAVLVGDMSAVGPRPERPELDDDIESGVATWPQRWFVKPGLTGLAQINGVTGHEPRAKLRYDVEYIRNQSFWYDLKLVVRQLWLVAGDAADAVTD